MFPRWKNPPRSGAHVLTKLLLAFAFVLALQCRAEAAGTLISAPNRVDMVHDSARDTLYITSGGSVLRYHLGTSSFLTPFNLGGSLVGLDLSPDGNTLVVADRTRTEANIWVHVIDLRTGASSKALTAREYMEGGTFTVAYGSDNQVLVTTTFEGSGWVPLRRFNPANGAWTKLNNLLAADGGTLSQDTMLAASGDRSVIGFAEANISDGRWGSYNVAGGTLAHRTWYQNGTSWFNFEIGVNKNGTQYAIPTYGGTFIYNASFVKVGTLGTYAGPEPIGVVYHPVEDIAYFPWTQTTQVRAFNMNTLTQVAAYDFQDNFVWNGGWAFQQGRMKMSRDGSLLFCTVTGGVRFVRLYAPLAAQDQSVTTEENTPVSVTLSGSVGNGGALSYRVATQPAHGTLSGTGANLVYTPEANYEGDDSFTFKSVYGTAESAAATVSVTVTPGTNNNAPAADDQSVTVNEDGSVAVTLTGSDPEGSPVTFEVVDGPAHGSLSGAGANLVYTPAPNFFGSDGFTFSASDGTSSGVGHVYVTTNSVNDAPTVSGQSLATNEDTPLSITLTAADIDNSPLYMSFTVFSPPTHGTLSGAGANLVYTPAPNYNGPDSFGFKATDGEDDSNDATVNINVRAVNDLPVPNDQSFTIDEDTSVPVTLSGTDPDGDTVIYYLATVPSHGNLSGTAPNYTYNALPNYNGTDTFTYRANDGVGNPTLATVNITINPVEDAPVAHRQNLTGTEDTAMSIVLTGSDPDGDALTYSVVSGPAHGTLTGTAPNLTYTPATNFYGSDNFAFTVSDGKSAPSTERVYITLGAVNDAPTASPQSVVTSEDTAKLVFLFYSDPDGNPLTVTVVSGPAHGSLSGTGSMLTYTPAPNYNGADGFTYKVNDGAVDSNVATVEIAVSAANDTPTANGQTLVTNEDTAKSITLTASDVDGDPLTYMLVGVPQHGSLTGTVPSLVYTPAPDYNGPDSFTFVVHDGKAQSAMATVSLNVAAVNDAPTAAGDSGTVVKNSSISINVVANDGDLDGDALTVISVTQGMNGSVSIAPGGKSVTYTPRRNFLGNDVFSYAISDGRGGTASASVNILVRK